MKKSQKGAFLGLLPVLKVLLVFIFIAVGLICYSAGEESCKHEKMLVFKRDCGYIGTYFKSSGIHFDEELLLCGLNSVYFTEAELKLIFHISLFIDHKNQK